jgi:BirA family transcriptional regulator, biotin operon repressor / biotin---[acetyl-CoA-carboxylase] ligase
VLRLPGGSVSKPHYYSHIPVREANPVTSSAGNPQRTPLPEAALRDSILARSRLYTGFRLLARTGSTNADLVAAARAGAPSGAVLLAEQQTSGRGRLDRSWQSQPGAALTFSVLLRPAGVPAAMRGWLPLLAGVAVVAGVRRETGLSVSLKWPNDVVVTTGAAGSMSKVAGILAEQAADAIVVGIGLNVSTTEDELPGGASSLWLQGVPDPDRQGLLVAVLAEFERWYLRWSKARPPGDPAGTGLRDEYLRSCCTVGRDVRVELPGGAVLAGRATDVDDAGRLLVAGPDGTERVSAGDVIHVR